MNKKKYLISIYFSFLLLLGLHAQKADSLLMVKLDLQYTDITLAQLLDSISIAQNIHFAYNPQTIRSDSIISINYSNKSLYSILTEVINDKHIDIQAIQNQIIISEIDKEFTLQNDTSYITIKGSIENQLNNQPIPYANIAIQDEYLGTISNSEGQFIFKIPIKYAQKKIQFSCIGFVPFQTNIPNKDTIINIHLSSATIELSEIKVIQMKADDIINRCLENIETNYPQYPLLLTGFFRERIKQNNQYIQVSEAVIEILKSKYSIHSDSERVKFIIGRKKEIEESPTVARFKLAGGPAIFSEVDIIKHFSFFNTPSSPDNFNYKNEGKSIYKDRILYHVGFKQNASKDELAYEGILYIDSKSFALHSVSFQMTKKTLKNSAQYFIKKSPNKIKTNPTHSYYTVSYKELNNHWYLHKVTGEITIELTNKHNKYKDIYTAQSELLITDAENQPNHKIKSADTFKASYILADKINREEKDFWKKYNIIQPEDDIEKVFKQAVTIDIIPHIQKKPDCSLPGF